MSAYLRYNNTPQMMTEVTSYSTHFKIRNDNFKIDLSISINYSNITKYSTKKLLNFFYYIA